MNGALLFDLAASLSSRFTLERSFAVRARELRTNRFVLSVRVAEIRGPACERILEVCGELKMPSAQIEAVETQLPRTRVLHFGYETGKQERLYKAYLEQETPAAPSVRKPTLAILGFKWDFLNPTRSLLTQYTWYPALSVAAIRRRIRRICSAAPGSIALQLIDSVVESPARGRWRYMEAEEGGNSRRSFDLNLYNAEMRLSEITPVLMRMWGHFCIEPMQWQPVLESDSGETLGHLSGGIHRNGEDFFNVYYGNKSVHRRGVRGRAAIPNLSGVVS